MNISLRAAASGDFLSSSLRRSMFFVTIFIPAASRFVSSLRSSQK